MHGKKPNGCNFMCVIEWNEIWELGFFTGAKKYGIFQELYAPPDGV